jgi:hypothetical protein
MTPNIDIGREVAARTSITERPFREYLAEVIEVADLRCGIASPLGAHEFEGGVNFALFSRDATRVQLEFFAQAADSEPERIVGAIRMPSLSAVSSTMTAGMPST